MQTSSIKKNFMYQVSYQILIIILPFITSPYIARVIGAEGLGTYSYSYSIAYYFVLFSMLGILNYGNRVIAQNRDNENALNENFSSLLFLHVIFSAICCMAYIAYVVFWAKEKTFAWIQMAYVLSGLFDISWFYFGIEKFKLTVTRNTLIKILNVVLVFSLVRNANDLWKYCVIMAAGMLLSQLTLWIPLRKYVRIVKPNWSQMKVHIKPLFVLFIPAIAVSLYKYMDKIMIGAMSSKAQLGFYENAEKVINFPLAVIMSFGTVMLPKMSNLVASQNKEQTQKYILISMKYIMCLAFALSFGLAGIGRVFAPVFWGDDFYLSGLLIMGLSITVPFMSFANVIRTQYLIPTEKDKEYLSSVIGGAIINLVINYMLIPRMGAIGATIGTVAAEVLVCIIQSCAVRKELPIRLYIRNAFVFIVFGMAMFVLVFFAGQYLKRSIITLFIQIVIGGVVYSVLCLVYFILTKDTTVMNMIRKIRYRLLPLSRK